MLNTEADHLFNPPLYAACSVLEGKATHSVNSLTKPGITGILDTSMSSTERQVSLAPFLETGNPALPMTEYTTISCSSQEWAAKAINPITQGHSHRGISLPTVESAIQELFHKKSPLLPATAFKGILTQGFLPSFLPLHLRRHHSKQALAMPSICPPHFSNHF